MPLRTPRDAFGKLAPLSNLRSFSHPHTSQSNTSHAKRPRYGDKDSASESNSEESFDSELSLAEMRMHRSAIDSCYGYDTIDESTSSDDDKFVCESELQLGRSHLNEPIGSMHLDCERRNKKANLGIRNKSISGSQSCKGKGLKEGQMVTKLNQSYGVPRAFWPYWVYRMYDSYHLAQRAAGSLTSFFFFLFPNFCKPIGLLIFWWLLGLCSVVGACRTNSSSISFLGN